MEKDELSKRYYQGQLDRIKYHGTYPSQIKLNDGNGIGSSHWMDLNEISAEIIVKKLIKEFNLTIS